MNLPQPIATYFEADRSRDPDAVAACFTQEAVVKDERKRYLGHDAIRRWKAEASTAYSYIVQPVSTDALDDRIIVTGHVSGNFPGSPIDLRYVFLLDGDRIAELEIAP